MRRLATWLLLCACAPGVAHALDLSVADVSVSPAQVGSATFLSITETVASGDEFSYGFFVYYYFSADPIVDAGDIFIGGRWVPELRPGVPSTETTTFRLPLNVWGTFYVGAIVDGAGYYADSNPVNDVAVWRSVLSGVEETITVSQPDLVALGVSKSGDAPVMSGGILPVESVMAVQGGVPDDALVSYYLSPVPGRANVSSDVLVQVRRIWNSTYWWLYDKPGPLWFNPDAEERITLDLQLPVNVWGEYQLKAVISPLEGTDVDPLNNSIKSDPYQTFTITEPDLQALEVSAPGQSVVSPGGWLVIHTRMGVQGGVPDLPIVAYYLVPGSGASTTENVLIGERVIWNAVNWGWSGRGYPFWFNPASPEDFDQPLPVPANLTGSYRLRATIRKYDGTPDPNANNNAIDSLEALWIGTAPPIPPPTLVVTEPPTNFETTASSVTVRGWVTPMTGSPVVSVVQGANTITASLSADGTFSATLGAPLGSLSLVVAAVDTGGQRAETTIVGTRSAMPGADGCVDDGSGGRVFARSLMRYCYDGAGNMTARLVAAAGQACGVFACP
jgi:hypothetical protein